MGVPDGQRRPSFPPAHPVLCVNGPAPQPVPASAARRTRLAAW